MIDLIISFLILLIPAYLISKIFFKTQLLTSIAISFGILITSSIFSGLLLNFLGITTISLWIFYTLLTICLLIFIRSKKIEILSSVEIKNKELIIFLIVLIFFSSLVYMPRHDYAFPDHADEWSHLSYADKIIDTGHLFNSPYKDKTEVQLESGIHIFLSEIFLMTKADIVLNYRYLPAIFFFFTALIIFITTYNITKKYWLSILTIVFLASLKSTAHIMGIWVFAPFSMSFPLIFLFLFIFSEGITERKINSIIFSFIILLTIILFHASTAIMIGIVAGIYLLFNKDYIKKYYIHLSCFFAFIVISGVLFSKVVWNQSITEAFLNILKYTFKVAYSYNYFLLYGVIASSFAIIGLFAVLKKNKLRIYAIFYLFILAYYLISYLMSYTFYIEYLRIVYLLLLASVILSAFGVYLIINSIKQKYIRILGITIFLILMIFFQFNHYYRYDANDTRDLRNHWQKYIDENDYESLIWLKQSDIKDQKIFSTYLLGNAIPITGNYPSARTKLMHKIAGEVKDSIAFFNSRNCTFKKEIIQKYNSDYMISPAKINCDFLNLEYSDKDYIYSVIDSNSTSNISSFK